MIAYRLLAGTPVKVQIARAGAACGAGAAPATQCAAQLAWNGQSFGQGVSVSNAQTGGARPTPAPSPATPAPAGAAAARLPVSPGAEPAFLAQCRKDYVSQNASATRWADDQCKRDWQRVVASGPAAEVLLAVLPAPGQRPSLEAVKANAAAVRWTPRATAPFMAVGRLGALSAGVQGTGAPTALTFNWSEAGAEIPFDVAGAIKARGVTLVQVSCAKTGVGEGSRVYAGTAPGRAAFTLNIDQRTAPTANAFSSYGVAISLDGRHPPRGSTSDCDF